MTVSTTTNKIIYSGLIGQSVFAYNFRVNRKLDMNVLLDGVLIAQGDWTIDGIGEDVGGNVTLNTPLVADATVTLLREVDETQLVDYQPFDAFPAETHEGALDKLTMITQQMQEQLDRAPKLPVDTPLDNYDLGTPVANEVIMYNAAEDGQTSTGIDATAFNANVQAAADSAAAADASETKAQEWAENPEDDPVETGPDQFSALHWAAKAEAFVGWSNYLAGYLITGLHDEYTGDLDDIAVNSKYYIDIANVTNFPVDMVEDGVIETDMTDTGVNDAVQLITTMDAASEGLAFIRNLDGGVWSEWLPFGAGGSATTISDTPPVDPEPGDSWWDSELGKAFVLYDDGTSIQWVEEDPALVGNDPQPLEIFINGVAQDSSAGTENLFDFPIPAGVKEVKVHFQQVKTNGNGFLLVQIGNGAPENTGYEAGSDNHSGYNASAEGFPFRNYAAFGLLSGTAILSLANETTNRWSCMAMVNDSSAGAQVLTSSGGKNISGALTVVRVTNTAGADLFDGGIINVQYDNPGQFANIVPAGTVVQVQNFQTGTLLVVNSGIVAQNDTPPQRGAGNTILTLAFTAKYASSKLRIDISVTGSCDAPNSWLAIPLFREDTADAIASNIALLPTVGEGKIHTYTAFVDAGDIAAHTFTVEESTNISSSFSMNSRGTGAAVFGGTMRSSITITEIAQ